MQAKAQVTNEAMSLPMRERGLKYLSGRYYDDRVDVAPHAGAWIEMSSCILLPARNSSLPMRERGMKYVELAHG